MDPTPATQLDPTAATAGLIALTVAMIEIIRRLVDFVLKKLNPDSAEQQLLVKLDPEASRLLAETSKSMAEVKSLVARADPDGTPLIYSRRDDSRNIEKTAEVLREVSNHQQRIAVSMERLDSRFEAHDKNDSLTFYKMLDLMARIEKHALDNHEKIVEIQSTLEELENRLQLHDEKVAEIRTDIMQKFP